MLSITEKINENTVDIDLQNGEEIARLINQEDQKVSQAVAAVLPQIGEAIEEIAQRLHKGGRMAYFGSGTSGRIGILDAAEMPPTYGVSEDLVQAYIAGGEKAIRHSVENAEDDADFAKNDMQNFDASNKDVIVAISASGNPAYTLEALRIAKDKGALTIGITSNPEAALKKYADIFICPIVGPEAIVGSSRMKAGTAQKMVLNMLSSGVMIRMGKVYHNYMIDLRISNEKLRQRAIRFVCEITGADKNTAKVFLDMAHNVKTACVMINYKCSKEEAENMLRKNDGILRKLI